MNMPTESVSVGADPSAPPDAADTPQVPVPGRWFTRFGLAWLGIWMAYLVPAQLTLPDQLDRIDHAGRIHDFAIVNGAAGIAAVVTLPLFGALCDRTRSRFGRRRVWVVYGLAVMCVGLVATGFAMDWQEVMATWVFTTLGFNMMTVGITAAAADAVPESQRGRVSTSMFAPQGIGVVLGLAALTPIQDDRLRYAVLGVAVAAFGWPFARRFRDVVSRQPLPPLGVRSVLEGLWISPRKRPEFAWAFGSRLMMNLANVLATCYLLFFLRDSLKVSDPDQGLLILTAVYLVFTLLATYGGTKLAERLGRRRVFVAGSAVSQAIACVLIVCAPSFDLALVAGAFLGIGYGAYMAVDQVVIMKLLPEARDRAKDLAIMNVGAFVPATFGPLPASLLIDRLGGYPALFVSAALVSALGAVMIYRVKSVR
ncbi:MFS transporter [Streptomyces sp. SL13]|jgi:MFS family permease|uniref:MFS transporter n=1 Tax=Streptantibioticus silvisoli TaxID=2705255 RepID=A0AA90H0D8_9ACTN|nr:MFS transporter [Streptantibioticus silvisoli]MDI5968584.1 MFS transporter [Streptantibioticus silvisoli]